MSDEAVVYVVVEENGAATIRAGVLIKEFSNNMCLVCHDRTYELYPNKIVFFSHLVAESYVEDLMRKRQYVLIASVA